jgi:hypothetical protein
VRAGAGTHAYQGFNCAAVHITVAAVIVVMQARQLLGNRLAREALPAERRHPLVLFPGPGTARISAASDTHWRERYGCAVPR